jgi:pimeloyl-ACP methyl ester carboxylesterase
VLNSDRLCYLKAAKQIDIPVLFLNGEWDEYTSAQDAKLFGQHIAKSSFGTIQATGHFLDMEHKAACRDSREALMGFLRPEQQPSRLRYHASQPQHAFAV